MKPLQEFRANNKIESVLTTITDVRLLKARIEGKNLPFSEDVIYIFDKQIEESDILIINKTDLTSEKEAAELMTAVQLKYHGKTILLQSAFNDNQLAHWLEQMSELATVLNKTPSMQIYYDKYASGEMKMAWFDKYFTIESKSDLSSAISRLFSKLSEEIKKRNWATGHLKLYIQSDQHSALKLSQTGMDTTAENKLPDTIGSNAELILNARIETEPHLLEAMLTEAFINFSADNDVRIDVIEENSFKPGKPQPVHRFS